MAMQHGVFPPLVQGCTNDCRLGYTYIMLEAACLRKCERYEFYNNRPIKSLNDVTTSKSVAKATTICVFEGMKSLLR